MEDGFIDVNQMGMHDNIAKSIEYAQVIFHNVVDSYSGTIDINCCYTLTECITPKAQDWVGIYKLGWTKIREFQCHEWSPMPPADQYTTGTKFENQITFVVSVLPKDLNEFYQFVYISDDHVCGASTPFQCGIKVEQHEGYVGVEEEEDDIIVIKKKSDALTDDLEHVIAVKNKLIEEGFDHQNKIDSLRKQLIDAEHDCSTKTSEIAVINKCWKECESKMLEVDKQEKNNQETKSDLIKELYVGKQNNSKLSEELKTMKSSSLKSNETKDLLSGQVFALESKVVVLHEHIAQLEFQKHQLFLQQSSVITCLKQELKDSKDNNIIITDLKDSLIIQIDDLKTKSEEVVKISSEKEDCLQRKNQLLMQQFNLTTQNLDESQNKCKHMEERVEILMSDISDMKESFLEGNEKLQTTENTNQSLNDQLSEKSAALYSLQVALKMLREKLGRQQGELDQRRIEKIDNSKIINEYKDKIEDMTIRLDMASSQYQQIYLDLCRMKRCQRKSYPVKKEHKDKKVDEMVTGLPPPIQPEILRTYESHAIIIPQRDAIPMPAPPNPLSGNLSTI